jgi:hypothetical protein
MSIAPKDVPIVAWCNHEADPYTLDERGNRLTLYAGHAEGLSHVENGPHVLVWGGGWVDTDPDCWMPDWWFQYGSDFEIAANPVKWMSLPKE